MTADRSDDAPDEEATVAPPPCDVPLPDMPSRPSDGLGLAPIEVSEGVDPAWLGSVSFTWQGDVADLRTDGGFYGEEPLILGGVQEEPADPLLLTGGQVCDRCGELAVVATEHVWRGSAQVVAWGLPVEVLALAAGRSGVLLWCRRHWRDVGLAVLAEGGVVVGVRGRGGRA